jgi:hypothetical protein
MIDPQLYLERLLEDESLAGDLDDAPREALMSWLIAQAEQQLQHAPDEEAAEAIVATLRRETRALAKKIAADPSLISSSLAPADRKDTR